MGATLPTQFNRNCSRGQLGRDHHSCPSQPPQRCEVLGKCYDFATWKTFNEAGILEYFPHFCTLSTKHLFSTSISGCIYRFCLLSSPCCIFKSLYTYSKQLIINEKKEKIWIPRKGKRKSRKRRKRKRNE